MGDTTSSSHKKKKRKLMEWRRRATHAGSWYEDDEKTLVDQNMGLGELLRIMVLQNHERDKSSQD